MKRIKTRESHPSSRSYAFGTLTQLQNPEAQTFRPNLNLTRMAVDSLNSAAGHETALGANTVQPPHLAGRIDGLTQLLQTLWSNSLVTRCSFWEEFFSHVLQ